MRGSKGGMLDMFRHPDKLLEAMGEAKLLQLTRDERSGGYLVRPNGQD